jgi:hypothetical protein
MTFDAKELERLLGQLKAAKSYTGIDRAVWRENAIHELAIYCETHFETILAACKALDDDTLPRPRPSWSPEWAVKVMQRGGYVNHATNDYEPWHIGDGGMVENKSAAKITVGQFLALAHGYYALDGWDECDASGVRFGGVTTATADPDGRMYSERVIREWCRRVDPEDPYMGAAGADEQLRELDAIARELGEGGRG